MSFALIIFDYDGVLIDSLGAAISVGEEFCRYAKRAGVQSRDLLAKEGPDFIVNSVQDLDSLLDSEYSG